jgi:hypothetical protein
VSAKVVDGWYDWQCRSALARSLLSVDYHLGWYMLVGPKPAWKNSSSGIINGMIASAGPYIVGAGR